MKKKTEIFLIIFALFLLLVIAVQIFLHTPRFDPLRSYRDDLTVPSDDGKYELLIREWDTLGGSGADIYICGSAWWSRWIAADVGRAIADDYSRPFSWGAYRVIWEDEQVTISYRIGTPAENSDDLSTWRGKITYNYRSYHFTQVITITTILISSAALICIVSYLYCRRKSLQNH